jgi:hypothetical protein
MAAFSARWRTDFATNPAPRGARPGDRGAAVHLVDEAALGQRLEVAPDRHVDTPNWRTSG